ncbi:tRNA modification GTPase [Ohtaekwangia sp.]|uniref:tRNA modification GTPase n=1 Tax=Ohtaekwangia sp. TaxID=2066019 RepID=UPI002FDD3F89
MKKSLLIYLAIFLSTSYCYSQIVFEKGYFINNDDQKTECLIRNVDWRSNPTEFDYKLSENDKSKTENIASVKEFGIYNAARYKRYTVKIDRSSQSIREMSNVRSPEFAEEQLFLKALVEGKASLYMYIDADLTRFFYQTDSTGIEQLVFKSFLTPDRNIGRNYAFKQQLLNSLKCESISKKDVERLAYNRKELIAFFEKYNTCQGSDIVYQDKAVHPDVFNLTIRAGINTSSLTLTDVNHNFKDINFNRGQSFRSGIELELVLPFNKNKWSIILEPSYQCYKSQSTNRSPTITTNYKVLEVPIGVRHYFFLNEQSRIFINASLVYSLDFNSKLEFNNQFINISSNSNFAFGAGYKFGKKYSIELRQQTNRDIIYNYPYWASRYSVTSLIVGFSIF